MNQTYSVDNISGKHYNDGLTPETAVKKFEKYISLEKFSKQF